MTKTKDNQKEDEILQNKMWQGSSMMGDWVGTGWWNKDKRWKGLGTWQGGLLSGTWDGTGEWESIGDGKGNWKGGGGLVSSMAFQKYAAFFFVMKGLAPVIIGAATVIGLIAVVTAGLLSSSLAVVGGLAVISLLFLASFGVGKLETSNGKWWGEGTWEDDEEFRILDMNAKWKLGSHEGILRGKMKDIKPR